MPKIYELASLVRSKNAGPFTYTFDILFKEKKDYERVKNTGVLTREIFAERFGLKPEDVRFFECDNAYAFKASINRPIFQGDLGDTDNHGGQQFAPLLDIEVP